MARRSELPVKLYYRIGEVAEVVGVEPHVLRYWESEFRTIRPQKSPKGQRVYSRKDLEKLLRVKDLLYTEGYTIAGAKKRLREGADSSAQNHEKKVEKLRQELRGIGDEIRAELESISLPDTPPHHEK